MSSAFKKTLNIIIPVYNEGDNILKTFEEIESKINVEDLKIFVVYDFPEDNTVPVVKKLIAEKGLTNVTLLRNKYGRGVLTAIKSGFEEVQQGAALVIMADLSDDLAAVGPMLEKLASGFDLVCGSRYMRGGKQIGGPKLKKLLSRLAGVTLHYLIWIPTHDVTNSFKLYSKKVLDAVTIESTGGFEIGMEIVIKSYINGFKIGEVPSIWRDRTAGESNFKMWKWLPKYIYWYLYAMRHTLLRVVANGTGKPARTVKK
ncbi:MAG: glycosyltransferase [Candidatus Margulisiibacteriota bacterium]